MRKFLNGSKTVFCAGCGEVVAVLKVPRRLWRRHLVGNPPFILRVLRQRLAGRLERSS